MAAELQRFQIGDKVVTFGPCKGVVVSQVYQEQDTKDFCCLVDLKNIGVVACSISALALDVDFSQPVNDFDAEENMGVY